MLKIMFYCISSSSGNTVFSGPSAYSRDSTPDSGASHYMDSYRGVNGKIL